jgi:hypothetical protein
MSLRTLCVCVCVCVLCSLVFVMNVVVPLFSLQNDQQRAPLRRPHSARNTSLELWVPFQGALRTLVSRVYCVCYFKHTHSQHARSHIHSLTYHA